MKKSIIFLISLCLCTEVFSKEIPIKTVVNEQALNCHLSPPILTFINDYHEQFDAGIKVNQANQSLRLGKNIYSGISGYQFYKTPHVEQADFAINEQVAELKIIKFSLQAFKSNEGESGIYYLIFKGSPTNVTFHLKRYFGSEWNIENTITETPQGNSKLVCVYAG